MKRRDLNTPMVVVVAFGIGLLVGTGVAAQTPSETPAPKPMKIGDILSGELNAMRSRAKGKRANIFQLVSAPRRLPPPAGLCNLETGPETFQIVTANDAQAAALKKLIGKEVSLKVSEVSCAEEAGQMSEAVVTKWSVVGRP